VKGRKMGRRYSKERKKMQEQEIRAGENKFLKKDEAYSSEMFVPICPPYTASYDGRLC
jgi:Icc-related predicted phosphoesterase